MKKILFYTSGVGLGGVEKVILEILKEIDKTKFDIKLGLQYANENLFENEIPKEVNYKYMLPQNIINKSLYYRSKRKNIFYKLIYSFMLKYEKYIIKKNYIEFSKDRDVVIDFKSGDFLKLINLDESKKRICWIHGEITKLNRYEKRKKKLKKGLEKCDKVVCICNEMKENVIKEIPEITEKLSVIYNPFDIKKIKELSNDLSDLSTKEKELIKEKYITMVSRLELKMKDFFTLFKAYKDILKKHEDIKLYILGDGPDKEIIKNKIKELKLEDKIILLGVKKNPYPWIKNAELLVHSSKYEGFGLVLVEALICQTLVVSTNCLVGPKEILSNGKYGSLVNVEDSQKMSEEILELLDPLSEKRKKYLENIKSSINRFDKEIIKKQIENMLDEVF